MYLHLNRLAVDELAGAHEALVHDGGLLAAVQDHVVALAPHADRGALAPEDVHALVDLDLVNDDLRVILEVFDHPLLALQGLLGRLLHGRRGAGPGAVGLGLGPGDGLARAPEFGVLVGLHVGSDLLEPLGDV